VNRLATTPCGNGRYHGNNSIRTSCMEIAPPPPDPPPGGGRMPHTHYGPVMGERPRKRRHGESVIAIGVPLTEGEWFRNEYGLRSMTYELSQVRYLRNRNVPLSTLHHVYVPIDVPPDYAAVTYDVETLAVDPTALYNTMHEGRTIFTQHIASEPVAVGVPVPRQTRQSTAGRVLPSFVGDPYDPTSRWGPSIQEWSPL